VYHPSLPCDLHANPFAPPDVAHAPPPGIGSFKMKNVSEHEYVLQIVLVFGATSFVPPAPPNAQWPGVRPSSAPSGAGGAGRGVAMGAGVGDGAGGTMAGGGGTTTGGVSGIA